MTAVEPWRACVLTIFPEMFPGPLAVSLAGQALGRGLWMLETVDIRAFARDKHRSVDDTPFGGGPGMVMRADVVDAAILAVRERRPEVRLVYLTPRGQPLDQARVRDWATGPGVALLCGRYEGVDERVLELWRPEEISIGDFVLSGGEPAAMVVIDACVRLLPGVVGRSRSVVEESFEGGLLEYPHYTRPRSWRGLDVPEVLLSGDHARIGRWRLGQARRVTKDRRPDLWRGHAGAAREDEDASVEPQRPGTGLDESKDCER
ncbi:MAG: tRNA (guanosine(37)-N1)-methyltransferase TrmD [Rhodospirillales bacterium]